MPNTKIHGPHENKSYDIAIETDPPSPPYIKTSKGKDKTTLNNKGYQDNSQTRQSITRKKRLRVIRKVKYYTGLLAEPETSAPKTTKEEDTSLI